MRFHSGTALHNGDPLNTRVIIALLTGECIIIETCIVAEYARALVSPVGAIHQTRLHINGEFTVGDNKKFPLRELEREFSTLL